MISAKQAKKRIQGLTDDQVRDLTRRRLLGEDIAPITGGYFDEPPEFLVIALLRLAPEECPPSMRSATVDACLGVYQEVLPRLVRREGKHLDQPVIDTAIRVSNVADAAAVPELRASAEAALNLAVNIPDVDADLLRACVRAAMSYVERGNNCQASFWEALLKKASVAAFAFNALLEIDPFAGRIEHALAHLWLHQLRDNWPVHTAALMRRTARMRGSPDWMRTFFDQLRASSEALPHGRSLWQGVSRVLAQREWSKVWLLAAPAYLFGEIVTNAYRENFLFRLADVCIKVEERGEASWLQPSIAQRQPALPTGFLVLREQDHHSGSIYQLVSNVDIRHYAHRDLATPNVLPEFCRAVRFYTDLSDLESGWTAEDIREQCGILVRRQRRPQEVRWQYA